MLEKFLFLSDLFDIYGALLTEKQQRCLQMSLYEDFSLSEIAEELGISRQAVHDNLHRSEQLMKGYEEKLGLLKSKEEKTNVYEQLKREINSLTPDLVDDKKIEILHNLEKLLK